MALLLITDDRILLTTNNRIRVNLEELHSDLEAFSKEPDTRGMLSGFPTVKMSHILFFSINLIKNLWIF